MNPQARIGLIIPSSNRMTEPQFHKYVPANLGVHIMRLRMTGKWSRPLDKLKESIAEAAVTLSDVKPAIIVFHCTASSMEEGLVGEANVLRLIQNASGCVAMTTGQAIGEALKFLRLQKLVLITPYVKEINEHEILYLREAGFEVIHDLGLGLRGGDEFIRVTPQNWIDIALENGRPEADGYLLSCTNTSMIDAIEELERRLQKPVVASNQATLWACLRRLSLNERIKPLGQLLNQT